MSKQTFDIYTDGSCRPTNPGPGTAAFIVVAGDENFYQEGKFIPYTTSSKAELTGVIRALEWCLINAAEHQVTIYMDSQYVFKGITEWMAGWKKRNWVKADKKKVLNKEFWTRIDELVAAQKNISYKWVKGHNGNKWNERVDLVCSITYPEPELIS